MQLFESKSIGFNASIFTHTGCALEQKFSGSLLRKKRQICFLSTASLRESTMAISESNFNDDGQPEIAIWTPIPEVLYIQKYDKIPTANLRFLTTSSSKRLSPGDSNNDRQPEIAAAETGNTYISETVKNSIEIPASNMGFATM